MGFDLVVNHQGTKTLRKTSLPQRHGERREGDHQTSNAYRNVHASPCESSRRSIAEKQPTFMARYARLCRPLSRFLGGADFRKILGRDLTIQRIAISYCVLQKLGHRIHLLGRKPLAEGNGLEQIVVRVDRVNSKIANN